MKVIAKLPYLTCVGKRHDTMGKDMYWLLAVTKKERGALRVADRASAIAVPTGARAET